MTVTCLLLIFWLWCIKSVLSKILFVSGHPNVKAFISHGGLLSTTESVYHGVPIVGIPIFGDQKMNIAKAVKQGYAVSLPFQDLNKQSLEEALNEILYNPKYVPSSSRLQAKKKSNFCRYYKTAQTKSKIMRDQPIQPMEKAIFWIEYVLRHGPCSHLRTAALKLSWHEYFLLDVLSILFVPASTAAALIALIIVRRFRNGGRKQEEHEKKNE